ncbi:MAG: hypothetical protein VW268_12080 [Rhodospirillaceae bacterium]
MDSVKSPGTAGPTAANSAQAPARTVKRAAVNYESDSIREVQARALHIQHGETAVERRGMRRLEDALKSGQGLRQDVPRGFYLNINV